MKINFRLAEEKNLCDIIEMLADDELDSEREDFREPLQSHMTTDKKRLKAIKFCKDLGFVDSHEGMKTHFSY